MLYRSEEISDLCTHFSTLCYSEESQNVSYCVRERPQRVCDVLLETSHCEFGYRNGWKIYNLVYDGLANINESKFA